MLGPAIDVHRYAGCAHTLRSRCKTLPGLVRAIAWTSMSVTRPALDHELDRRRGIVFVLSAGTIEATARMRSMQ